MMRYKDFYGNEVDFLFNAAKTSNHQTFSSLQGATCSYFDKNGSLTRGFLLEESARAELMKRFDCLTSQLMEFENDVANLVFYSHD